MEVGVKMYSWDAEPLWTLTGCGMRNQKKALRRKNWPQLTWCVERYFWYFEHQMFFAFSKAKVLMVRKQVFLRREWRVRCTENSLVVHSGGCAPRNETRSLNLNPGLLSEIRPLSSGPWVIFFDAILLWGQAYLSNKQIKSILGQGDLRKADMMKDMLM